MCCSASLRSFCCLAVASFRPLSGSITIRTSVTIATCRSVLGDRVYLNVPDQFIRAVRLHQLPQSRVQNACARFRRPDYKFVRHPIYLASSFAFWAAAMMTVCHLLFAA